MEKATVKFLFENNRYRIIHTDSNYYLIDVDRSIWGYIFFVFNWMIPQKAYIITERDADDLMVHYHGVKAHNIFHLLGIGLMMIVFTVFIPKVFWHFGMKPTITFNDLRRIGDVIFVMPTATYIIFLFATLAAPIILYRVYLSRKSRKRLLEKENINKLPVVKINIVPNSISNVLKTIGIYVFLIFLLLATAWFFIQLHGDWLISLFLVGTFSLLSLSNNFSFVPGAYKIRCIQKK
ncbi:DUF443 family protein [Sporosarcina sp. Marseille-Q4063]|uniref:DUF443 family protein n=1 Tax=Sporosarcina sp. Marseille-Q4063 TaxID=2810514 RepID=UPI001BAF04DC|nr:DUF443 family protein [Sporosarcina sp. Marseille-Q4063]QUW21394.1 DUF443 family protein [Sporosarcina sp. Marseille-Q4063]